MRHLAFISTLSACMPMALAGVPVDIDVPADFDACTVVLPDEQERRRYRSRVVRIDGARHNDMRDAGSAALKTAILAALDAFLAPARQAADACAPDARLEQASAARQ